MDIATILTQLAGAARQGGLPGAAQPAAGAGNPLAELAARFGIEPTQIGDVLGHMGAQAQAGIQDPGVLAQAAAERTGAPAGGLQDLLGQLMGAVQGMQGGVAGAGGAVPAPGGFDLSAILGQLMGGLQGGAGQAGGLGSLAGMAAMLDRDGDGQVMDDIADMAGRFLNRP
jgi:hypothetical protein